MYCGKCGAKNEDGARFCGKCGQPLEQIQQTAAPAEHEANPAGNAQQQSNPFGNTQQQSSPFGNAQQQGDPFGNQTVEKKSHKGRNITITVIVILLIAAIGTAYYFFIGGDGYKEAVKNFVDGGYQADVSKAMKVIPDKMIDASVKTLGISKDEYKDKLQKSMDMKANIYTKQYGEGWQYGYEITSDEKMSSDDLKSAKETYEKICDLKVREGRNLTVKITLQSKDGSKKDDTSLNLQAVKIGGSWYLGMSKMEMQK